MTSNRFLRTVLSGAVALVATAATLLPAEGDDTPTPSETCDLEVRVTGTGQTPIARARVECGVTKGTTDADGLCLLKALAPGRASVTVSADGWKIFRESIEISGGTQKFAVSLQPLVTTLIVEVVGRDADGSKPIDRCEITVRWEDGEERTFRSDATGRARMRDLARGVVKITASAEGWKLKVERSYRLDQAEQTLRMELERLVPPA